jgi:glutamate synthase domain-containing protein 3
MQIDAKGLNYRELNRKLKELVSKDDSIKIDILNVNGHRYIGTGLENSKAIIRLHGVPGNDLAAFMNGGSIFVYGNAEDGVGNTMNAGLVVIHGDARDVVGYSMRGGKIFIKGDVGYRAGIHMKAYKDRFPSIVVGGKTEDFLGEYMAGGVIVILNLNNEKHPVGNFTATGIHGGTIFVRGKISEETLGIGAEIDVPNEEDLKFLKELISEYSSYFKVSEDLASSEFTKIHSKSHRPFGKLYILD